MKDLIKFAKGLERNYDKKVVRTLKDLKNLFKDREKVKEILKKKNPVIYKVYIKKLKAFNYGLTVINKGVINREYYFTKGHNHKKPSIEKYVLLGGEGKLILQKGNDIKVVKLKKNKAVTIPKNYAHRAVNTGNIKLKFLSIYRPDSGHKYDIKFKKRLFKK